jgi:hypothetical protein
VKSSIFRLLLVIVLLVIALSIPSFAFAQEATPEVTPVVVTDSPISEPTGTVSIPSWLLVNAALVFMALSAFAGMVKDWRHSQNLKLALDQVEKSRKDAIESATNALPDTAQDVMRSVVGTLKYLTEQWVALVNFVDEVTDGKPNEPPEAPERG